MNKKGDFTHDVKTKAKPWTHLDFCGGEDSEDFNFAIVGDRSGRPEHGIFEETVEKVNLLGPDFVMSVGDFVEGFCVEDQSKAFIEDEWNRFEKALKPCRPPFFRVVGNHDIPPDDPAYPETHDMMEQMWKDRFGATYYSFVRKNVLFLCLHSTDPQEDLSDAQLKWAVDTLKKHENVRWTMIFMHRPGTWLSERFAKLEEALYHRNYTVFAGDLHQYTRYIRNGRKYYMIGTSGGGFDVYQEGKPRGHIFGEFHQIVWVSFQNGEPKVTILDLKGIYKDDCVTTEKITWLTPKYFRADKKLSAGDLKKLRAEGIIVE